MHRQIELLILSNKVLWCMAHIICCFLDGTRLEEKLHNRGVPIDRSTNKRSAAVLRMRWKIVCACVKKWERATELYFFKGRVETWLLRSICAQRCIFTRESFIHNPLRLHVHMRMRVMYLAFGLFLVSSLMSGFTEKKKPSCTAI